MLVNMWELFNAFKYKIGESGPSGLQLQAVVAGQALLYEFKSSLEDEHLLWHAAIAKYHDNPGEDLVMSLA